jgi:hypothetical protein
MGGGGVTNWGRGGGGVGGGGGGGSDWSGKKRMRGRAAELLRRGPSLVPFGARVRWFKAEVGRDRAENAGRGGGGMDAFGMRHEHHIQVTRGYGCPLPGVGLVTWTVLAVINLCFDCKITW